MVNAAESFGISYDRIFNDKIVQKQPTVVPMPPIEEPEVQDEKCDYMNMNLYRDKDTIYRAFSTS